MKIGAKMKIIVKIIILITAGCVLLPFGALADTTISVTSFEGGRNLNFGKVDASSMLSREMEITVTSSANASYQVRQVIIQPLTAKTGETPDENVLSFYTVRGSNARGSLYKTIREPLIYNDEVLYISDSRGTSDSFKLVYFLDGKKLTASGSFYGKISFVLETKDGQSQTSVFNIEFNSRIDYNVNMEISGGSLRLNTRSESGNRGDIAFDITGSAGRKLDIYQRPEIFPVNHKGDTLPPEALKFYISGSLKGKGEYKNPIEVGNKELLIYTSAEGSDSFQVNFLLDPEKLKNTESAIYRGSITYRIRQEQKEQIIPLDIEIDVAKIFDMKITSEGLSFNIKPGYPPQEKTVLIEIESNLDTPYQITQRMNQPLTDDQGNTIDGEYFSMRRELIEGEGEVGSDQFKPVEPGEEAIFTSGGDGGNASLRATYRLNSSPDIIAGNYTASFTYSLSEK